MYEGWTTREVAHIIYFFLSIKNKLMLIKSVFCAGNTCPSSYIYRNASFIPKKNILKDDFFLSVRSNKIK